MENELLALWLLWELSGNAEIALALHSFRHVERVLHERRCLNEKSAGMQAEICDFALFVNLVLGFLLLDSVLCSELVQSLLEDASFLKLLLNVEHFEQLLVALVHLENNSALLN